MNIFKYITQKRLRYSIIHTLVIFASSLGVAFIALSSNVGNNVDFRFVGPVAMFLLVISAVFTLFPFTYLRTKAVEVLHRSQKSFTKDLAKNLLIVEAIVSSFLFLSYLSAMSGSIWGGVGLILLSVLNILGMIVSIIALMVGLGTKKFYEELLKYRVNSLNNYGSSSPLIVQEQSKE